MKFAKFFIFSIFFSVTLSTSSLVGENITPLVQKHEVCLDQEKLFQVQCALAAFRTLKADQIWYVSSPITSGKRLYDFMDAFHYTTLEEARVHKDAFKAQVILPNIEEAESTGTHLLERISGVVVSPTSFEGQFYKQIASQWSEHAFMALWLNFIEMKVDHILMLDGWEYSNGASEEFLLAIMMQCHLCARNNIEIFDARYHSLSLDQGISLLEKSTQEILNRNLSCPILCDILYYLKVIKITSDE